MDLGGSLNENSLYIWNILDKSENRLNLTKNQFVCKKSQNNYLELPENIT